LALLDLSKSVAPKGTGSLSSVLAASEINRGSLASAAMTGTEIR
jgi:hypothetical protein